jgi:hypothetical protein
MIVGEGKKEKRRKGELGIESQSKGRQRNVRIIGGQPLFPIAR